MEVSEDVERFVSVLRVLSNAYRFSMLLRLLESPLHVKGMEEHTGLGQALVSHHLGLLELNGVVTKERQGKRVVFTVRDSGFVKRVLQLYAEMPKL